MLFKVHAVKNKTEKKIFYYDNIENIITDEFGVALEYPERNIFDHLPISRPFSKHDPLKKSKNIRVLKIQLGLSCNYSCSYCSQKFVKRPEETTKKDIDAFLAKMDVLNFNETDGLKIEFWGGEPFVYWKTLKPLAEALEEKFEHWKKKPIFSVITNGSLLTREICSWLYYMGFHVGISHDGPGQPVRGPDPFVDPDKKKILMEFFKLMNPLGRISFNAMMNSKNTSRKAVYDWFVEFTGDPSVKIGEGSFVDAYDEDGLNSCMRSLNDHFAYRRESFNDIYSSDKMINFVGIYDKIDNFTYGVLNHYNAKHLNQKCGMDDEHVIAVDLKGNITTCQNVSVKEISKNGEPHNGGNLNNYDKVELKSVTHWKNRKECVECPVLQLCKGSCMYLDGKYWDATCDTAYSDNVPLFALSFEKITGGYIPAIIESENLKLDRQDIWGTFFKHENLMENKIDYVEIVSEKIGSIDGIEVYGNSIIKG